MWEQLRAKYQLQSTIGSGSYGEVVKAKCRSTNAPVAIKFIQNVAENEYDCVKVIREI